MEGLIRFLRMPLFALLLQHPPKLRNVHIAAGPLSAVVRNLGHAVGEDWRVDGIGPATLVVDADGVTPQELKATVSMAIDATFFADGSTQVLKRTRDQRLAQGKQELLRLTAATKDAFHLAGLDDPDQTKFKPENLGALADAAERQIQEAFDKGTFKGAPARQLLDKLPAKPYLKQIGQALGPAALAGLFPGSRSVYSTNPTPMQKPLPRAESLWADYTRDLERVRATVPPGERGVFRRGNFVMRDSTLEQIAAKTPPAKLVTVCSTTGSMGSGLRINLVLEAIDADGKTVDRSSLELPIHAAARITPVLTASTAPIAVPESVLDVLDRLKGGSADPTVAATEEPLAAIPASLLQELAAALHLKLLAIVPDALYSLLDNLPRKPEMPAAELVAAIAATETVDMRVNSGWLVVTPTLPAEADSEYVDRESLHKLLRAIERNKAIPTDALASFYLSNPTVTEYMPLPMTLIRRLTGGRPDMFAEAGAPWLRFYGVMAATQGTGKLWNLRISQLSPDQMSLLTRATYSGSLRSTKSGGVGQTEPTELYGDGIPPDGFVLWTSQDETKLAFHADGETDCTLGLRQVAALMKDEKAQIYCPATWRSRIRSGTFVSVRPIFARSGALQISPSRDVYKHVTRLTEGEGQPCPSISALPQAIQDELNRAIH